MSYGYDSRYYEHPRHDSYYTSPRGADAYAYSRHEATLADARRELTDMRASNPYTTSYPSSYEPRTSRPRQSTSQSYRSHRRKESWPPPPSVEDEPEALAKEARSQPPSPAQRRDDGEPPVNTRGTVDQEFILDEIEQPSAAQGDDRRSRHNSGSATDPDATTRSNPHRDRQRRSFADRGPMSNINTDVPDPPLFTERERMPYGYSQSQKESTAPISTDFLRSPEPMTPSDSRFATSDMGRVDQDAQRRSHGKSPTSRPSGSRHNSLANSRPAEKDRVFDSDSDTDSTTHLRADRKPARYSFVQNDLQREALRTNLRDTQHRPESTRRDSGERSVPTLRKEYSSNSSKENLYAQSPKSSASSLNNSAKKPRPVPVDTAYANSPRPMSRPSSPLPRTATSSQLPTRLKESPPGTRPSSRSGGQPPTPLSHSSAFESNSPGRGRFPISETDQHTSVPPVRAQDRSRPPSRYGRYETIPTPRPRGDVQSSLPTGRPSSSHSALPYPMDDQLIDVLMPPEQNYQYNHSPIASPRQDYIEPPRSSSPSATSSPYIRDSHAQPSRQSTREEPGLSRRARSNSIRSQDDRREKSLRRVASLDLKSLPDCPRSKASREYDDWYSLRGFKNFNICPDCYKSVFFETRFDGEFKQIWLDDWSIKRACDFSNPWPRLAWYLTVKQRLKSLDLLYAVADIMDTYKPCPGEREKDTNEASWYGIVNQRDGMFVPNFAICSSDRRLAEALFPSIRGYFPRITAGYSSAPSRYTCSFRMSSRRLMKYLELLMELDEEAQISGRRPDIDRFVDLARDYAFKGECARDKILIRKPWYFIPQLPEFTVCEECYDRFVWPAMQSKSLPTTIPRLFNKSIQLVPGEDPEAGSSCCLWSPRMRSVWMRSVEDEDFAYLKRKALERKKAQVATTREREDILRGLGNAEPGDSKYEWAKRELDVLDREWASYE
ncbi:hypothetical protein COCVIDRAFT_89349 [Bipolaris victoriae FI3]|uniref:Uncharacterized protein n=1 Tax=Bipolaris victoriae (strain FI3) TaxID=930091 RepID=W7ERW1_BIPV3|nr:hypothetical protein COCVIDRAFT_89349 [Bipolaris victoriae FI3]